MESVKLVYVFENPPATRATLGGEQWQSETTVFNLECLNL